MSWWMGLLLVGSMLHVCVEFSVSIAAAACICRNRLHSVLASNGWLALQLVRTKEKNKFTTGYVSQEGNHNRIEAKH